MGKLFTMAMSQLVDYSSVEVPQNTPATVVPIVTKHDAGKDTAEYATSSLVLAAIRNRSFKILEPNDMQGILDELSFQLSDLADENKVVEMG